MKTEYCVCCHGNILDKVFTSLEDAEENAQYLRDEFFTMAKDVCVMVREVTEWRPAK